MIFNSLKEVSHKGNSKEELTISLKESEDCKKDIVKKGIENDQQCRGLSQTLVTSSKEKTPMCLVNELSRFNKVHIKYLLRLIIGLNCWYNAY